VKHIPSVSGWEGISLPASLLSFGLPTSNAKEETQMDLLDGILHVFRLLLGLFYGIRHGFNSIFWRWLALACLALSGFFFLLGWVIPGVICAAGCIACFIKEDRWVSQEMKEYRRKKSEESFEQP
jgi:hypothetical protein